MKRVLVVDDEDIICRGVSRMIDPQISGCGSVGGCRNGIEAVEFLQREQVDILITDIRMPGMDGLQLIAEAKKIRPNIGLIVMSGYAEFEYAKQALQLGVKNYILKPVSSEELNTALSETVQAIENEQIRAAKTENLQRVNRELLLRDYILYGYVADAYPDNEMAEAARETVTMLILQGREELLGQMEVALCTDTARENILLYDKSVGKHLVLLQGDAEERIAALYAEHGKDALSAVYCEGVEFSDMPERYREIVDFLEGKEACGLVNLGAGQQNNWLNIRQAILNGDAEQAVIACEDVMRGLLEDEAAEWRAVVADMVSRIAGVYDEQELQEEFIAEFQLEDIHTPEELARLMMQNITKAAHVFANRRDNQYSDTVQSAIAYIEAHLESPDLSLGFVAGDITYLNKDYFGKLFKKETGEYFTQYVMNRRMQKAKELLTQTELKMYNIAEMVGFDANAAYFAQVFKRYTGLTPSEYQRLHRHSG